MKINSAGLSDVGRQRDHNEDGFCILPEYQLFIVADGMGGHQAGDTASQMAIHSLAAFFEATSTNDATWPFHFDPQLSVDENRLLTGIKVANKKIFEASVQNVEVQGMGTTVVSMLFSHTKQQMYVAHVGDSRCYRIRGGKISQLTRDHSLVNDYLLVMPDMTQEQQDEIPKNVITRALGMQDSVVVDIAPEKPCTDDLYLLCSDGLTGMITDEEILRITEESSGDVDKAAQGLVDLANENGGEDNITVVLARVTDESPGADKDDDDAADEEETTQRYEDGKT